MAYSKTTWVDEVLAGSERFEILNNGGSAVSAWAELAQCQIVLETAVTTSGTALNATNLNNIENGLETADANATEGMIRFVTIVPFPDNVDVEIGNGIDPVLIPFDLNGYNLTDVIAGVDAQGVTGTTDVQIRRVRSGSSADMLSTKVTIAAEYYARDGVINTSNDDLATGDKLYVDIDAIHSGTAPQGLSVTLTFEKP